MVEAWLPGAVRIRADGDGGRLSGGVPRVVWHTTESDPRGSSASCVAHHLNRIGSPAHLVWNPLTGDSVQMIPATRAARTLHAPGGGGEPHRHGRLCIQVEVVGFARDPFTDGPLHGLDTIMAWLDSWGVPRRWPAGPPEPADHAGDGPRSASRRQWAHGGHIGHSQVPDVPHTDPGAIDVHKIIECGALVPQPRLAPFEVVSAQA